jgi:glycosyltransferase involved in cell wall biosynthesis
MLSEHSRHSGFDPLDMLMRVAVGHGRYDVVHAFGHRPSVLVPAWWAARRQRIPLLLDWCDLWGHLGIAEERGALGRLTIGRFDHFAESVLYPRFEALTVISTALRDHLIAGGVTAERIHMLQVGANVDDIQPLPADTMRQKHGLPLDAHIALYAGFAAHDIGLIAEAFVIVARQDPQALLVFTGGRFPELEARLAEEGFADRVRVMNLVPYEQYGEMLACADVLLLPYTNRPINLARYPHKLGDYIAAGRPVVTNPTGDVGPLMKAEGIGLAVDETPEAFADAILRLFSDPDLRARCGQAARRLAEERLSWRTLARSLAMYYQTVSARRSTGTHS